MSTARGAADEPPGSPDRLLDGRYELGPLIAQGGMSWVYRGVDRRLDRPVAIKVMRSEFATDPSFLVRFEREARSAAALHHPGVVAVYDQGRDGDTVFLVMELVDGGTLRDLLHEQGALSVPVALSILEPMLSALGAAHEAGLLHRDIKPENVLISSKGDVKIADFGLVRAVTSTTMATGDVILGTVAYLSPEQVSTGFADARSDVYAAGIVGFEMLTGVPPVHRRQRHQRGVSARPLRRSSPVQPRAGCAGAAGRDRGAGDGAQRQRPARRRRGLPQRADPDARPAADPPRPGPGTHPAPRAAARPASRYPSARAAPSRSPRPSPAAPSRTGHRCAPRSPATRRPDRAGLPPASAAAARPVRSAASPSSAADVDHRDHGLLACRGSGDHRLVARQRSVRLRATAARCDPGGGGAGGPRCRPGAGGDHPTRRLGAGRPGGVGDAARG